MINKQMIDSGPNAGVRILDMAGDLPLTIMQSLPADLQQTAQIFEKLHDERMPDSRWNPADQVKTINPQGTIRFANLFLFLLFSRVETSWWCVSG